MKKPQNIDSAVDAALRQQLSTQEKQLMTLRFGLHVRPHRLAEIVRQLDISPGRVRALEAQALRKLRAAATRDPRSTRRASQRHTHAPTASVSARSESSSRTPRRGEMEERELMRIAAFKLQDSAKRIGALADEASSPEIRGQLSSLAHQLMQHANALVGTGVRTPAARAG